MNRIGCQARGRLSAWLLTLLVALAGVHALAAESPPDAPATPDEETFAPAESNAPIVVWNRRLIVLRAPFGHLTPAERAAAAQQRIDAALETMRPDDLDSTWVQAGSEEGALIRAGSQ